MELSFNRKEIPQLGGCHHDIIGAIEKSGPIKFINKIMYKDGFYKADLVVNGFKFPKTFFPAHWPRQKVISKICEAYDNFLRNGPAPILKPNGKYLICGYIEEGIKIEMYITQKGVVKTAYPLLK